MTFEDWMEKVYMKDSCWDEGWDRSNMWEAYRAGQKEMRDRAASFFIDFIKHHDRAHLMSADFLTLPLDGDEDEQV